YDDGRMTEAARAWFILQWFGVDAVVLDGGWKHLQSLTKVEEQANHPHARTYRRPEGFVPVVGLVDRTALARRLGSSIQILDARTPAEYRGEDLRKNSRGGHLPNASLLPHADLLGPDGTLKAVPELRELLEGAGIGHTAPVVTHCDGGGRAALAALAAVAAGHRDVSAYYLSFSDWAADGSC
ncbi:sulfurtransferase, partial [Listeria monocytogenes]